MKIYCSQIYFYYFSSLFHSHEILYSIFKGNGIMTALQYIHTRTARCKFGAQMAQRNCFLTFDVALSFHFAS